MIDLPKSSLTTQLSDFRLTHGHLGHDPDSLNGIAGSLRL